MNKVFLKYDNTQSTNTELSKRLEDLDRYYHYKVDGWIFDSTKNLDSKLNELADTNVGWVVVSALGNYLRMGSIDDEIIRDCQHSNSPLAGHLLDRNGYYNIDPQFFCLNLEVWDKVGRPSFAEDKCSPFVSVNVDRSLENFHDNYTPHWIKSSVGDKHYNIYNLYFGAKVLRAFLEHGYTIINISEKIRQRKIYLYPNANADELTNLFLKWDIKPTSIPLAQYYDKINQQFEYDHKTVYILNSEPVIPMKTETIDHYVGVCGGLKAVAILNNAGFTSNTSVSLFDLSKSAIEYQRYLVKNWDGDFDNYQTIVSKFQQDNPNLIYAWRSWNSWSSEIDKFLQSANMTKHSFKSVWQLYIKLSITYTHLDLHNLDKINEYFGNMDAGENKNYYVWVSNAYFMEHTLARYGKDWLDTRAQHLLNVLNQLHGQVWLEKENKLLKLK